MSKQLSENEKVIWFMVLIPLLWPFIPVVLICMAITGCRNAWDERGSLRESNAEMAKKVNELNQ